MSRPENENESEKQAEYLIVVSSKLDFERAFSELTVWGKKRDIHIFPVLPCDPRPLNRVSMVDVVVTGVTEDGSPLI